MLLLFLLCKGERWTIKSYVDCCVDEGRQWRATVSRREGEETLKGGVIRRDFRRPVQFAPWSGLRKFEWHYLRANLLDCLSQTARPPVERSSQAISLCRPAVVTCANEFIWEHTRKSFGLTKSASVYIPPTTSHPTRCRPFSLASSPSPSPPPLHSCPPHHSMPQNTITPRHFMFKHT